MRPGLLVLAATTILTSCERRAAPSRSAAAGGTLVIATTGDVDILFPPVTTTALGLAVSDRIFCRLADLTLGLNTVDDSGFRPVLARAWEHRDAVTIVFHLDRRARWQDGAPVTAADVAFTFAVYRDPAVNSPLAPNLVAIDTVTAPDDSTAVFRFRRPYPEQLYDATYHMRILPKHLLDTIPRARLASAGFARHPVGDGPYRFVAWQAGAQITLTADSAFWLGAPHVARLVWRIIPDLSTAVTALLAGEADAMELIPSRAQLERVQGDPARSVRLVPYPSPFYAGIVFNLRRPLFADREVRRAIAMALDRTTIVRSVFGSFADVAVGATSPMQWIWSDAIRQIPHDTAAAARALDGRGWRRTAGNEIRRRDGTPLQFTLLVPTSSQARQQAAVIAQDELRRLGVAMRIEPLEFTVMQRREVAGDFDAAFESRTIDPSPASLLQFWGRGESNVGRYASARFDSLAAAAQRARSRAEAAPLWRRALEQLNDDAAAVFIFSPRNEAAIATRVTDVTIRPDDWLATVADWRIADRPGR